MKNMLIFQQQIAYNKEDRMRSVLENNLKNPIFWIWIIAIYIFIIFAGLSSLSSEEASVLMSFLIVIALVSFGIAYIAYMLS
jgi:hypothetical protein